MADGVVEAKLTLRRGANRVPPPAGPLSPVAHNNQTSARILIAEDNVINQKVAIAMLAKFGYRAVAVANGREAVQALLEVDYDLVLMDCQMPEMDGFAATRQIRASRHVKNSAVTIIALTANAMVGVKARCLEAGMNDFISKPIKAAELSRMLELWLNEGGVVKAAGGPEVAA